MCLVCDFLVFLCILTTYKNSMVMSQSVLGGQCKYISPSHHKRNGEAVPAIKLLSRDEFPNPSYENLGYFFHPCIDIRRNSYISDEHKLDSSGYLDTLTNDDKVKKQYSLLPYPPISRKSLSDERNHYGSIKRNMPFNVYFSSTLESINHFLYQGRNNFRQVSIHISVY